MISSEKVKIIIAKLPDDEDKDYWLRKGDTDDILAMRNNSKQWVFVVPFQEGLRIENCHTMVQKE